MSKFQFTFDYLENLYKVVKELGYSTITCKEYCQLKNNLPAKVIVNRIDIDFSVAKTKRLVDIFNKLGIKGTFFLRLHAPEYNPFSFENYRIIRYLIDSGHELGYHSEVIDQAAIWAEDAQENLIRDIDIINRMFNTQIVGVASHGGMTGLNNLDFWKDNKPADYGLLYEGYDKEPTYNLFQDGFYVSDSEWIRWKCYIKGVLQSGDHRNFAEHAVDAHPLIHLLIHPDTYYDHHFYELE